MSGVPSQDIGGKSFDFSGLEGDGYLQDASLFRYAGKTDFHRQSVCSRTRACHSILEILIDNRAGAKRGWRDGVLTLNKERR